MPWSTVMPAMPRPIRFTEEDFDVIKELGQAWGPVQPLGITAVIREALRRALQAERRKTEGDKPARKEKTK